MTLDFVTHLLTIKSLCVYVLLCVCVLTHFVTNIYNFMNEMSIRTVSNKNTAQYNTIQYSTIQINSIE